MTLILESDAHPIESGRTSQDHELELKPRCRFARTVSSFPARLCRCLSTTCTRKPALRAPGKRLWRGLIEEVDHFRIAIGHCCRLGCPGRETRTHLMRRRSILRGKVNGAWEGNPNDTEDLRGKTDTVVCDGTSRSRAGVFR